MRRVTAAGFIAAKVNVNQVICPYSIFSDEVNFKNKAGENESVVISGEGLRGDVRNDLQRTDNTGGVSSTTPRRGWSHDLNGASLYESTSRLLYVTKPINNQGKGGHQVASGQ